MVEFLNKYDREDHIHWTTDHLFFVHVSVHEIRSRDPESTTGTFVNIALRHSLRQRREAFLILWGGTNLIFLH